MDKGEEKNKCQAIRNVFELITACQMYFNRPSNKDPLFFTIDNKQTYTWPVDYSSFIKFNSNIQTVVMIFPYDITVGDNYRGNDPIEKTIKNICQRIYPKEHEKRSGVYVIDPEHIIDVGEAYHEFYDLLVNQDKLVKFRDCIVKQVYATCVPKDLYSPKQMHPSQFIAIQCKKYLEQSVPMILKSGLAVATTSMVFRFEQDGWFSWPLEFIRSIDVRSVFDDDKETEYKLIENSDLEKVVDKNINMRTVPNKNPDLARIMIVRTNSEPDAEKGDGKLLWKSAHFLEREAAVLGWNVYLVKFLGNEYKVYDFYSTYEQIYKKNPGIIPSDKELTEGLPKHTAEFLPVTDPR